MPSTPTTLDAALRTATARADPYPFYRRLLDEAPVHWSAALGVWMFAPYDLVLDALRDGGPRYSLVGTVAARLDTLDEADQRALEPLRRHYAAGMMHSDPPEHTRIRGLISKAFTPRVVEGLRPRIAAIVSGLLDEAQRKDEIDLVADFAFELPAIVISEVLGLPTADRHRFKRWSDDIASFIGKNGTAPSDAHRAQASLLEARAYMERLAEERRREPRDDLISRFVAASDSDALSLGELLSTCITFLVGGHETTTSLISSGVLLLDRDPDQRRLFVAQPALAGSLIEEVLRFEIPAQRSARRVARDIDVEGHALREGESVYLLLAAANRDPARFPEPDRFDIQREPNRHLSFGMGPHFCIGAPLARLEAEVALTELYARYPDITVTTAAPSWIDNFNFRQLRTLPVALA